MKTAILTDTPEKQAIEKAHKERTKKLARKKQNSKEKGKPKKESAKKKIVVRSSKESLLRLIMCLMKRARRMREVSTGASVTFT